MNIKVILTILLSALALHASPGSNPELMTDLTQRFRYYNQIFPREKVYIHLNKTVFKPQDVLWFKAYIVEALQSGHFCE